MWCVEEVGIMERNETNKASRKKTMAAFYLWTIRRQQHISDVIKTHMISAAAVVLLLTIILPLRLETALQIVLIGGLTIVALLWVLVERRKSWLLAIEDPALKDAAHQAMITYLRQKVRIPSSANDKCRKQAGNNC
jgi:hypothetical protein